MRSLLLPAALLAAVAGTSVWTGGCQVFGTCSERDRYATACRASCAEGDRECRTQCEDVREAVETCYDACLADPRAAEPCCARCVPDGPNQIPVPYPERARP